MSVRARTAENVAILVILQWLSRGSAVLTKIVLVRLLFPQDFGIFALATGLVGFVATFGNFGLDYALIQRGESAGKTEYDVAMSLRLLISSALFAATVLLAIPWSGLFGSPVVAPAAQLLALVYLVTPWSFVPSTRLSAKLDYRAFVVPNILIQIANAIVSIGMALAGFGVWALVAGSIVMQAVWVLSISLIEPWSFRFRLDNAVSKSLLGYARHLILVSVLAFLMTNIDNYAVGYFLGSTILGYYAVAYSISLVTTLLSGSAASALFPSFSRIQKDEDRLRRGYVESLQYAVATLVPSAVGLAIVAPEVVVVILGPEWIPATLPLTILCIYGLAKGLGDFSSSLFAAVGRPQIVSQLNTLVLALSVPLVVSLTIVYGTGGTAVAMTIPVSIGVLYSLQQTSRILNIPTGTLLARMRGSALAAGIMGVVAMALRFGVGALMPQSVTLPLGGWYLTQAVIVLVVVVPISAMVYFVALRLADPSVYEGMKRHLRLIFHRRTVD